MRKSMLGKIMMVPLVACLVSGCGAKPQAASDSPSGSESQTVSESQAESQAEAAGLTNEFDDFSEVGITAYLPDAYEDTVGVIEPTAQDISAGEGVYIARLDYIGMSGEDYDALMEREDVSEDELNDFYGKVVPLLSFVVVDQNRDVDAMVAAVNECLGGDYVSKDRATLLGQADDCSFYSVEPSAEELANVGNLEGEFKDEYETLVSFQQDIVDNLEFAKVERKVSPSVGKKVSFEAVDFDGNTVKSDEIFSQNEITMVNVWATWCHWCVEELADLEALNQQLAGKNCAIIGLCGDADTDEALDTAKDLIAENGVTYLNIRPYEGWDETFIMDEGWPTSFFVDKTGTIVGSPVAGAMLQKYQERFDELLGEEAAAEETDADEAAAAGAYDIYVKDQDGNAVEGAMVQFCTDEICKVAPTDADGLASFDDPEGAYEVHVLKVPEGYKGTDEVFKTEAAYGDVNITIEKE